MMDAPGRTEQSQQLFARACALIPGGTQLISRRPHAFAPGVAPLYATRGRGARIWDVDGHEYIDYGMSVSACILGYADPVVTAAVREQLDDGVMYSLNHPAEIELAERLTAAVPCAEMVRYAKGGGEACAIAVRIARGATGRDKVLFSGYHGWHDWYLAANLAAGDVLEPHLLPGIEPLGVPRGLAGTSLPFPYGDVAALERLLDEHSGQVAAVMLEPMRSRWPPPGYLAEVRSLTRRHGAVLIFDEVTTGFRHAVGGVETLLEVTPDLAVFAKSLSNGFAMAAVVGSRAVMEPAARMFISSTNWSDLVGIRAALATLQEIERRDVPRLLREFGERFQAGWNQAADRVGIAARMTGLAACPQIEFTADSPAASAALAALYAQEMACRGVLCHAHPVHSAAHDEVDLDATLAAAEAALAEVECAGRRGDVVRRLVVPPAAPVFRRLVD